MLGSHPPRLCGLATFASDLTSALKQHDEQLIIDAYAIEDDSCRLNPQCYPISMHAYSEYGDTARMINRRGYDVLSIQHEFGIYGGIEGDYLLDLVRNVNIPIISTLHTVLSSPTPDQYRVLDALLQLSSRIVVMSLSAIDILSDLHKVDLSKVDFIPHGIPTIREIDAIRFREKNQAGSPMLLTFGLLSPDKGIEQVIRSLPRLLERYPEAQYWVVGATHPNVEAYSGSQYRTSLLETAESLGIADHVRFVNAFVPLEELVEFLAATDFYITPYLNPMQITSGTLAYSMGAGKVVISTPYVYAREVLAEGRGILVPFADPDSIAEAVAQTFADPDRFAQITLAAEAYGSEMRWECVAPQYIDSFQRAMQEARCIDAELSNNTDGLLPKISLTHLKQLSDDTGILQHARFAVPLRSEGYCVDDNARALIVAVRMGELGPDSRDYREFESKYLAFLNDALDPETLRFRNFLSYQRTWLEKEGSEDSQGRALWALGVTAGESSVRANVLLAQKIFDAAAPKMMGTTSPRTWAYTILGCVDSLRTDSSAVIPAKVLSVLSYKLYRHCSLATAPEWPWLEARLAYANARIPEALIAAGSVLGDSALITKGIHLLRWLLDHQTSRKGCFSPVGCSGASLEDFGRPQFDQQPIEAASSVSACLRAYRVTKSEDFLDMATWCFQWFLGRNDRGSCVAIPSEGSCYDGLLLNGVNQNQGAESTLSYLSALQELRHVSAPAFELRAAR